MQHMTSIILGYVKSILLVLPHNLLFIRDQQSHSFQTDLILSMHGAAGSVHNFGILEFHMWIEVW